ncbi:MAG TPA: RIP metalloprotease RseP [Bacteroidales bacterium]|nr:RIP metalloprotease RseP [Bacteroidales bacterium]
MTVLIKILQFIVSLSILVIIHELGHFLFAKLFKTRVEKFYLFFDPWFSLFKFRRGETEYGIGWVPLGGYVKISGMIDESMDTEQMKQPPQPWEFRSKKSWQRLLIMTGGVLFNFAFALVIYVMVLYSWGETYLPTSSVKYGIVTDSTGYRMGLRNGDKIISVDNQHIENFSQILADILLNDRKTIQVERDGENLDIEVTKEYIQRVLKGEGMIEPRTPFGPFVVESFARESPARSAGIQAHDELIGLDGHEFEWYDEFQAYLAAHRSEPVTMNMLRNGEPVDVMVTPTAAGFLGIVRNWSVDKVFELKKINYGFFESVPAGIKKGFNTMGDYLKQFRLIFSKETKAYESLGGFITIGSIFPGVWDWQSFWTLTAFLSIILAIMNILPIPALDGGHVMFLIFEVISGRKPSDRFLEYAQIAGMALLFALLIYANGNDVVKLLRKFF